MKCLGDYKETDRFKGQDDCSVSFCRLQRLMTSNVGEVGHIFSSRPYRAQVGFEDAVKYALIFMLSKGT